MRALFRLLVILVSQSFFLSDIIPQARVNPVLLDSYWPAEWITHPQAGAREYSVCHFRKAISLLEKPSEFIIHVTADNRYRLFINGTPVCFGPARSDPGHWIYESIDIAEFLQSGKNVLAAVVWNFGDYMPVAQMSRQTGFLLQGDTEAESMVNTGNTWKCYLNEAYTPLPPDHAGLQTYIVVGPGDRVNGNYYPWGWENSEYDDSEWINAKSLHQGRPKGLGTGADLDLVPREIPFMEESVQRFSTIRRQSGTESDNSFLEGKEILVIQANRKVSLLLDQGFETVAYPEITISGGKHSTLELVYAEALFDVNGNKGNRNDIEGKFMKGLNDIFISGGGRNEMYRPLWFRTFRYVELIIETFSEPLEINNIQSVFTAYPFRENATFNSSDPELGRIWETGWRTLRLCSNETHYDCPYYEQLQYVGDTRIQCLVSSAVSGDDRLTRNAIQQFNKSRIYEGLTQSRYPSNDMQIIPPFSLYWTQMIHDYWMRYSDTTFIRSFLFGIEGVLSWYENHLDPLTGMLGKTPYWNFVDWPEEWPWDPEIGSGGVPEGGATGGSSILTLQFAYALNDAAELFSFFGYAEKAQYYLRLSEQIKKSTIQLCWDNQRNLLADSPLKTQFSQHAGIMAVLSGAILPVNTGDFILRVANDSTLIQATVYYRFYLMRALKKAGHGNSYVTMLEPWRKMLDLGLTTFAERPEPTRSDCHAWSASPNFEFLSTVCGIEPLLPGFQAVKIEPFLGSLEWVEGSMPHPQGQISVSFKRKGGDQLEGTITIPEGLDGIYFHGEKQIKLKSGKNIIVN